MDLFAIVPIFIGLVFIIIVGSVLAANGRDIVKKDPLALASKRRAA